MENVKIHSNGDSTHNLQHMLNLFIMVQRQCNKLAKQYQQNEHDSRYMEAKIKIHEHMHTNE